VGGSSTASDVGARSSITCCKASSNSYGRPTAPAAAAAAAGGGGGGTIEAADRSNSYCSHDVIVLFVFII